jgi:hypothetical protein
MATAAPAAAMAGPPGSAEELKARQAELEKLIDKAAEAGDIATANQLMEEQKSVEEQLKNVDVDPAKAAWMAKQGK